MTDDKAGMEAVDLSQMSDEDVMKMGDDDLMVASSGEVKPDSEGGSSDDKTGDDTDDQGNPDGDTGGADTEEDPSDPESKPGDPFAEGQGSDDGSASDDGDDDTASKDDQSEDKGDSDDPKDEQDGDDESTFEAKYKELMAPFRAAKREVQLDNIEDARRLMQMGVDYSRKMETMKPHLRVIRTLEAAELLDPSRINFLIDLSKNDPAAIKKLLKDNDIDPMALNLEGSEDYTPTDYAPGEAELAVREVFENIKGDPKFDVTLDVITNKLDKVSRESLQERPEVIAEIHNHIEAGIYDTVMDRVANERMFGKLKGLSDLQAYYTVGDQMYQNGELGNQDSSPDNSSASADDKPTGTAQGSGSDAAKKKADLRNRKRAAKPPRGKPAKGGKKRPDFSKMTDKEIEELDISSF